MSATVVWNKQVEKWQTIYRPPRGGKRRAQVHASREEAQALADGLNERDRQLAEAKHAIATGSLLGEHLLPAWLEAVKGPHMRDSSLDLYKRTVKSYVLPFFARLNMRRVDKRVLREFGAWLTTPKSEGGKGLAVATCKNGPLSALRSVLLWAADEKLISRDDVLRGTVKFAMEGARAQAPVDKVEKPIEAWSIEERRLLVEVARDHAHGFPVLFLALESGMRSGEIFALNWHHLDLHGLIIRVEGSLERKRAGVKRERKIQQTKTGKVRPVHMSPALAELLRALHRERMGSKAFDRGLDQQPVFVNSHGKRWNERSFGQVWERIRKRAHVKHGVRALKLHATRATFASHALLNGASAEQVAEQIGDTVATLHKHYAGFIRDADPAKLFTSLGAPRAQPMSIDAN